jgi:hypothetical protein
MKGGAGRGVREDHISEVGIDDAGSLFDRPATESLPDIFREAMEVGWDPESGRLFSPRPREWSYPDWFRQMVNAAKEQGVLLRTTPLTLWTNVPDELWRDIRTRS